MLVLAIDTSTSCVSVALGENAKVIAELHLGAAAVPRHAETLAPGIRFLCDQAGVSLGRLAAVAVGSGPGLFTGLRVGVTTAKVMAQSLGVPVVAIPSLDLVAYPLRHSSRQIVAVLDARRREVFSAAYRPVPGGVQRMSDYAVRRPDELVAELAASGEEVLLAGDGIERHHEVFSLLERAECAGASFATPSVSALVELASARVEREEFEAPSELRPLYLRQSDAEINWERA